MSAQPATDMVTLPLRSTRCRRIIAAAASVTLLCPGMTSCTRTQVALSITAIAAVVVGTTVGVTLAVQHSHHTLQGCIVSGAGGLELRLPDAKVYTLEGELAEIKEGNRLKVHGSKIKRVKGDSGNAQVFVVEKVNKDYGPCPASLGTSPAPAH